MAVSGTNQKNSLLVTEVELGGLGEGRGWVEKDCWFPPPVTMPLISFVSPQSKLVKCFSQQLSCKEKVTAGVQLRAGRLPPAVTLVPHRGPAQGGSGGDWKWPCALVPLVTQQILPSPPTPVLGFIWLFPAWSLLFRKHLLLAACGCLLLSQQDCGGCSSRVGGSCSAACLV